VPQAAAGVLAQLRQEMSAVAGRDNLALQERTDLLRQFGALLQVVNQASGEQRAAIEALVSSAASVLDQAGRQFAQALAAQAGKAADVATHVSASAIELASLGEGFSQGVQLFQASNDKLMETLQRIEASLNQSTARSDEQLAYYVAQAREVIDLSIASQQGLVDNLRQLQGKPAALADGARG
jgi:cysteine synthase